MSWYDHNTGWWGFAGVGIGMILFWSLIIVGIIVLIRFTAAPKIGPTAHPPTPEQVLADRFARGEISDTTEYRDRLTVLRGHTRHWHLESRHFGTTLRPRRHGTRSTFLSRIGQASARLRYVAAGHAG